MANPRRLGARSKASIISSGMAFSNNFNDTTSRSARDSRAHEVHLPAGSRRYCFNVGGKSAPPKIVSPRFFMSVSLAAMPS